ncbi:MAG: ATP-binding protein, partial [Campylobacterales bacterium]
SLINGILDLSKIEAGKLNIEKINFNLYHTINNVIAILESQARKKNLQLKVDYKLNKKVNYIGDELRISQIITNLCSNAIKFTDNGSVIIRVSKLLNDKLRFEVQDTGIGLTKKEQEKLFNNFIQADGSTTRKYGGTGLGLSISKQLVELMGGKIWIESEKGKGSNFIFDISLKEAKYIKKNVIRNKTHLVDISTISGSKILLAEDDKINQEIIIGLLDGSGIQIDTVEDGLEAVNKVKQNHYELILMDYQMPVMDGLEATKIIRQNDKKIPIIAFSANVMKEDILKIEEVGMNEVLAKPINTNKFYNILLQYIPKKIEKIKVASLKCEDKKQSLYLEGKEREKLFYELDLALNTMQPKKCDIVLKKIMQYKLLEDDIELFEKIKEMIDDFEFEEASNILKDIL